MPNWKEYFLDTPNFDETKAFKKLMQCAENPIDLKTADLSERVHSMSTSACGWMVSYAFERIDNKTLDLLIELANERKVLEQMQSMQMGKQINWIEGYPSENRMVLHTATRDIQENTQDIAELREAKKKVRTELEKLKVFLEAIEKEKHFTEMVIVGIGGSELGPKAIAQALDCYRIPNRKLHFIGNIDPDDISLTLKGLDLSKTLVVIVSKSGTTLETTVNEEFLRDVFHKSGLKAQEHFIAVTMPKTPMDRLDRYRNCFYLEDYVGGRFSSTSMVGALPLGFAFGYNAVQEFLHGAHEMDLVALRKDAKNNLPLLLALVRSWNRNFLGLHTVGIIPYSRALSRFVAHLQQCDMESNGKSINRKGEKVSYDTGPVIWGEPGTNAQHSFFQLLHQGTATVPLEMIGCLESQEEKDFMWDNTTSQEKLLANLFAQLEALAIGKSDANPNRNFSGNRPSLLLLSKKLTPYAMGALLSLYEHAVAYQGFLWGINSFDQEGVQLGKKLADECISGYQNKRLKAPIKKQLIETIFTTVQKHLL